MLLIHHKGLNKVLPLVVILKTTSSHEAAIRLV